MPGVVEAEDASVVAIVRLEHVPARRGQMYNRFCRDIYGAHKTGRPHVTKTGRPQRWTDESEGLSERSLQSSCGSYVTIASSTCSETYWSTPILHACRNSAPCADMCVPTRQPKQGDHIVNKTGRPYRVEHHQLQSRRHIMQEMYHAHFLHYMA